jgi:putative salt-induced outer membrane protein
MRPWFALPFLCLTVRHGAAQTPPAAPPPLLHAQIDLGFVNTGGNSRVRTLNVAEQFVVQPARWKFTQSFSIVDAYASGVETANNLKAGVRADYAAVSRFRVYGLVSYYRDRFAGVARRFEEAAGLAYGVLTGPTHLLDLEAGAGRTQQAGSSGPIQQYWISRVAVRYRLNFTPLAYAEQKLELLSDLQDLPNELLNTESALVAPLSKNVALKLGYTVRFSNRPQPTFKKTDTMLSAGLQLQF